MSKRSQFFKIALNYTINMGVIISALFVEEIRQLHPIALLLLVLLFPSLQLITSNVVDYFREKTANVRLQSQARKLRLEGERTKFELDELRQVVVSFLEHSKIYRSRVKDHLKLTEDYLCIVKSSEGLSKVFEALKKKVMLPFGSVLLNIPGSVRPFERMGLYLIPTNSLPGINEFNVKAYIEKEIIPVVEKARLRFLDQIPADAAILAEPFSYKYMAFLLRKGAISHDVLNRKFNREFNTFIVHQQHGPSYSIMKDQLGEMVKSKEILALVNWASFAKLNREQSALVEDTKVLMSESLLNAGVENISHVARLSPEDFLDTVWPVLQYRTTERKAFNLSKKIVSGASSTVEVLRKHGVTL